MLSDAIRLSAAAALFSLCAAIALLTSSYYNKIYTKDKANVDMASP
jgi:hypothetical protein